MRRLLAILGVTLLALGALATVVIVGPWADLEAAGLRSWRYRRMLEPPPAGGHVVLWLGDSTLIAPQPTWADLVAADVLAPAGAAAVVRAWVGLGFEHYYCMMDAVTASHPDLVVMVANLRVFGGTSGPYGDLCSALPARELVRAATLPWHTVGLSVPRLLVLRLLEWPAAERALFRFDGLRQALRSGPWADAFAAPGTSPELSPAAHERVRQAYFAVESDIMAAYDAPLSRRSANFAFAAAAVRLATERGVRSLVVVSPVPIDELSRRGWYREGPWRHRIAALRRAVEGEGGMVLDLHDAVPAGAFEDRLGHLAREGAGIVAARVEPIVRAQLGLAPTP